VGASNEACGEQSFSRNFFLKKRKRKVHDNIACEMINSRV
jgi:hypothetical protein